MTILMRVALVSLVIGAVCLAGPLLLSAQTLSLADGLSAVTQENRLIRIRQQEEAMSQADTLIARSGLLPHVDASYNQNYTEVQPGVRIGNLTAPTAEKSSYGYSLAIKQILYDFKGISSQFEASKKVFEGKQLDTKRIRNDIALQFAFTYFDLLEAEKLIMVAEKERERFQSHLEVARSLYDQGTITKNDLLQAEVRLSDATQKLLTVRNLRKIHASQLNNLLARPLTTSIVAEEVQRTITDGAGLDEAQRYAEKERYEVKIINLAIDAVKFEERSREAEYLPKLFAAGQYDYAKNKYQLHEGAWSLLLGMNINFLSGGSTKAELSKLMYQKMQLVTERQKLIDDIKLQVERYYLDMENARDRIRVTKDSIGQAEENLKINRTKYMEGVGTATDLIDAITLLTVAETNYYRSLYDAYRSEAGFIYAMGRDLPEVYR